MMRPSESFRAAQTDRTAAPAAKADLGALPDEPAMSREKPGAGKGEMSVMIMADKIIEQRKKNGWSQEELAEKLHVSRQSVSKWEGAQSVPDLNKVIAMAGIFGVSTDYLLKDEVEELPAAMENMPLAESDEDRPRRVSMEEANAFLAATQQASGQIAVGVMLCILSPIIVILAALAGADGLIPLTEDQGAILGVIVLMFMVAAAVLLFVKNGLQLSRFGYLEEEIIDTEYGVSGMVKEHRQEYEHTHMMGITLGVILCVLSAVPVLGCSLLGQNNDMLVGIGVSITLIMVAIGAWQIVKVSIIWGGYQKLLEEGDYSRKTKRTQKGILAGTYWCIITAIYLAYSFWTKDWGRSWMIWPVAGVLYVVVIRVEEALQNRR